MQPFNLANWFKHLCWVLAGWFVVSCVFGWLMGRVFKFCGRGESRD